MLKVEHESQIVAHKFLDLVMMKDHAKVRAWLKNVEQFKTNGEVILAELKCFDGTPLIAEVMATPITIRGEKSTQLFVRDVTQRILTEKELNKERELNENLIKSIPDYIYFKDCSGKFIKINKSFSRALGLSSPDQAVGKTDKHYFGIKHFQHTQREEKQIIQNKRPLIGAIRKESWPVNNGQWVSVTKMPLYGPDREVIGTFGVSRDITKQRQSEEELRRREERFRHFFGQVQVGVAIVNSSFEVLEVNNAFCSISNYSKKELIDTQFLRFFTAEQGTEIKKQLGRIKANQAEHYQTECKLFLKNGNAIYVIFQLLRLDASNERKDQFLCQVVDINDRMVAEEQLLIRNNELNNFVYKVSHDLRAPLLSVKGLINLMRIEKDPALYESYVGMIEERVEKLDGFIRDILSHSKNLNTEVSTEEIDLKEVIENCFAQMQFYTKSIDIEKKVAVNGASFFSDAQRIQEILRNLISNAVIYSSKERKQSFVHVNVRSDLKKCTILVEDNGIGIKKVYLDKIFQMFYRANDKVEGSGIGLYIVQQSVLKLGGQVHVESKLNSGTRFTLTIPNNLPKKKLN
jgi:PAS domain S-box-containing protein